MKKHNKTSLIKNFFGITNLGEMKAILTAEGGHAVQLASAIARQQGIDPADCDFEFVQY